MEHWKSRIKGKLASISTKSSGSSQKSGSQGTISESSEVLDLKAVDKVDNVVDKSVSRRDKLKEWVEQQRRLKEEKMKKAKPVFRAGGKVQHPYSAFSQEPGTLGHNSSKLSMSVSNLSMMSNNNSFRRPQPKFSRSTSLTNFKSSSQFNRGTLKKIDETNCFEPEVLKEEYKKSSFAPENFEFKVDLEIEDPKENVDKDVNKKLIENVFNNDAEPKCPSLSNVEVNPERELKMKDEINENNEIESCEVVKNELIQNDDNENDDQSAGDMEGEVFKSPLSKSTVIENVESKVLNSSQLKVKPFRDLLVSETNRLTSLCNSWEGKLTSIPEDSSFEDIKGEIRTVIGQGRLIMAERFHQFSGLVDNCEFSRGEKETTDQDLKGFWEMIFIQVEDVNNKFENLVKVEENSWKPLEPIKVIKNVLKPRPQLKSFSEIPKKPKEASTGLKALIAARRKAAKSVSSPVVPVQDPVPAVSVSSSDCSEPEAVMKEAKDDAKTFDGGFFTVKSPM